MKNSNDFINKSVYKTNLKYVRLQNKTKDLFFKCLNEGRDLDYFSKELKKIWGNIDHSFLDNEIEEYKLLIHENNITLLRILEPQAKQEEKKESDFIKLISSAVILKYERKLVKQKQREYERSLKSEIYKADKKEYLKKKVSQYSNGIVPYYEKKTGKIRYVELSTYSSMIHNTNLTRSAWNTTLNDANTLGYSSFYIPFHNFSCPHCLEYQGRRLSKEYVEEIIGIEAEEQSEDILHPNCKCTLLIYNDNLTNIKSPKYGYGELEEQYQIRQKVNALTLKKERIMNDLKIQKSLGNQDEADNLKSKLNKVNSQIGELKQSLPTEELQKQVVAINR